MSLTQGTDLGEIIGGVAAALAIVSALLIALRWGYQTFRRRQLLDYLRNAVQELHLLDRTLRETIVTMEHGFSAGFDWTGYAVFTGTLRDCLQGLQEVVVGASDLTARLRSLDATGADERLRRDVETIADGIRRVAPLYIWGIVRSYRAPTPRTDDARGGWRVHIPPTATGREPARTLREQDREKVREVRLSLRILFRTLTHRLNMPEFQREGFALWPTYMAEAYTDVADLKHTDLIPYEDA